MGLRYGALLLSTMRGSAGGDTVLVSQTPWRRRFKEDFKGPILPFGCEIQYKPITEKDKSRCHAFGSSMLAGVFLGYYQYHGGGWSGDLFVADWEEMSNAQHFSEVYVRRFKADEVIPVKVVGNFRFPCAEGDLKQPGQSKNRIPKLRLQKPPSPAGDAGKEAEEEEEPPEPVETQDDGEVSAHDPVSSPDDVWACLLYTSPSPRDS